MPNDLKEPPITAEKGKPQPASAAPTAAGGGALQDVLTEVHALAQKCGGMDKLAEIVNDLRTSKPV